MEIITVHSENHTKHVNTVRAKNTQYLNITAGGTYSNDFALKG
jgi:hypothetical protein